MNFSLKWFKDRKKEKILVKEDELITLQIEKEKRILDSMKEEYKNEKLPSRPYKRTSFVNNVLNVILNDGNVISKYPATVEDFDNMRKSMTEQDVFTIMKGKDVIKESKDEIDDSPNNEEINVVCKFPDFELSKECIYMNGIKRSLPPFLVKRFGEILSRFDRTKEGWEEDALNDMEYSSLKKFWLKCCLNPNAQSAEDLYTFLVRHNMKIDRHGNFYAYRRVCKVNGSNMNASLVNIISTAYNNVKAVWKKRPENYRIEELNGEYSMHKVTSSPKGKIVGNLDTLYLALPEMAENRYTDAHTHSMDYRVGEIASIPRHECDDNNKIDCSRGLHIGNKRFGFEGFGDTSILAIINPMDAIAVPQTCGDKLRVSRWFFAMVLDEDDKFILEDDDFDVTNLGDVFEEKCLANLEEHTHKSFAEEVKRHTFTIPQISNLDITNISATLKNMHDVIKNRVVNK